MDIRLPNGRVIRDVPREATKEQIRERAIANGLARPEDFPQEKGLLDRAKDLWTGDDRREFDYPEIPGLIPKPHAEGESPSFIPIHDKMATAAGNPLAAAQIYQQSLSEAGMEPGEVQFDIHGNPYTTFNEQPFYLNRPGASSADVSQAIIEGAGYALGASAGGKAGSIFGFPGKVVGSGVGMGSASALEDKWAQVLGSDRPVDWKRAQLMAVLGAGGEIGAQAAARLWQWGKAVFSSQRHLKGGSLTAEGRKTFERAGLDPDVMTPEFFDELYTLVSKGAPLDEAGRAAAAKGLRVPVPLTKGQATGNIAQQGRELAALHAAPPFGETGRQSVRAIADAAETALKANADDVAARVSGGARQAMVKGEGAAKAASEFVRRGDQAKAAAGEVFDMAKQGRAMAPREVVKGVVDDFTSGARQEAYDLTRGPVAEVLKQARRFTGNKSIRELSVGAIETWRRNISRKWGAAAPGSEERVFLGRLRGQLDDAMQGAFEQSLIRGDASTIGLWSKGRGMYAEYKRVFDTNALLKRLRAEELTPEEMVGMFFGAGKFTGSKGKHIQAFVQMRKVLGPDSKEWGAFREEAFLRLLRNQPTEGWSAQKFVSAFDEAMRESPTLMKTIFTPEQLGLMRTLRNQSQATIFSKAAGNPSQTSYALMRQFAEFFGPAGRVVRALGQRFAPASGKDVGRVYAGPRLLTDEQAIAAEKAGYLTGGAMGGLAPSVRDPSANQ